MNNITPSSPRMPDFSVWLDGPLSAKDHRFFQSLELSPLDWMTIDDLVASCRTSDDLALMTLLALMFAALQEGSLCLEITRAHVDRLVAAGTNPERIFNRIERFFSPQEKDRYAHLITDGTSNRSPLILETSVGIRRIYFQKYHLYEKRLHHRIEAFLSTADPLGLTDSTVDKIMADLFSQNRSLRLEKGGDAIFRDREQAAAIRQTLVSPFTIISGGPGTGKTSVMVNIMRGLVRAGIPASKIVLAAPTGRAAQRMTEAISRLLPTIRSLTDADQDLLNLKGGTLHQLLRYRRHQNDFYYHAGNPLPVEVVIIDEVSMVDVVMLATFLEALDPSCTRLILMGDKDQLPSVEAGAVFAEMIPADDRPGIFEHHLVVLKNNYRAVTKINQLAAAINQGQCPAHNPVTLQTVLSGKTGPWAIVTPTMQDQWRADLHRWADYQFLSPNPENISSYPELINAAGEKTRQDLVDTDTGRKLLKQIFDWAGRSKILTLLRRGPLGCDAINPVIEQYLATQMDPYREAVTGLFSGAIIMVTRNDYSRNLFNGDMGVVIGDNTGLFRIYFQRADDYQAFAVDLLPAWEPAFAITVHKSQGSEFDNILLVLPDDPFHRLLTREILYTGVTRARKQVTIYGSRPAIDTAVSRKISRQSGLIWSDRTPGNETPGGERCDSE